MDIFYSPYFFGSTLNYFCVFIEITSHNQSPNYLVICANCSGCPPPSLSPANLPSELLASLALARCLIASFFLTKSLGCGVLTRTKCDGLSSSSSSLLPATSRTFVIVEVTLLINHYDKNELATVKTR